MIVTIGEEIGQQLRELAAKYGREPDQYLAELLDQAFNQGGTLPGGYMRPLKTPDWVLALQPACPPTDGTNGLHRIVGKWPGDETDAEILEILERNS